MRVYACLMGMLYMRQVLALGKLKEEQEEVIPLSLRNLTKNT